MNNDQTFIISDAIRWNETDLEVTLLDLNNETLFSLVGVGTPIWKCIAAGGTFGQTVDQIAREFSADLVMVERDVTRFLGQLAEKGWIVPAAGVEAARA